MSKNQDLGFESSIVRAWTFGLREASVPLRAAVMERDGDLVCPKVGGAKRRRALRMPFGLGFVGERPAAAGAEAGVVVGRVIVFRRGGARGLDSRKLADAFVLKL